MVRAIDLQQSILQTSPTEKIQQIQQQHADMQQRYQQLKQKEDDRLAREKIQEFDQAQKSRISEKEGKKDQGKNDDRPPHRQPATDRDEPAEEGGIVDVKV